MRLHKLHKLALAPIAATLLVALPHDAKAVPVLQIYVEGATYDTGSESWVLGGVNSFNLWVIGNVGGPGGKGTIFDVKLSAAVATGETGTITLTSTTTSLLTDPSAPAAPIFNGKSADGAIPLLGDGSSLPTHGVYGAGTSFYEWGLGDLALKDSPIADFMTVYPTSFTANAGQINAYHVTVSGFSSVHFDAYDHVASGTAFKYKFAPFSHDGETTSPIPEPETYAMLLAGLGLLGFVARRRKLKLAA